MAPDGRIVYSTDGRARCATCGKAPRSCTCRRATAARTGDGIVRVSRSTKGRRGKGVTVITGVPLSDAELAAYAKELKKRCGSGGTVKDGVIEIQGDHRDTLVEVLSTRGWTVRRSGG